MSFSFLEEAPSLGPFRILTVCTGNICRSPLAESLLRKGLAGLPVELLSAGTRAVVNDPMPPQIQSIALDHDVHDAANHRSRQVTKTDILSADLVLALDRAHRREIVEMLPRASRYTFTLREFARLSNSVPDQDLVLPMGSLLVERLRNAVDAAARLRGSLPLLDDPFDDDVVDPYRNSDEVYRQSADQLIPAVNAVVRLLHRATSEVSQ